MSVPHRARTVSWRRGPCDAAPAVVEFAAMKSILEDEPIDPASIAMSAPGSPVIGVAMLLWACDPVEQHRLAIPFLHASAAASMKIPVEIYFSARSVLLLQPGIADNLRPSAFHAATVLDAMREAAGHGAVLVACTDALQAHGMNPKNLIAECTRRGSPVEFMDRVCDPGWRTLVF